MRITNGGSPLHHLFLKHLHLSPEQQEYASLLSGISPAWILDDGVGRAVCRDIGQGIFDRYKRIANGDSFAGVMAVQNIWKGVSYHRKQAISSAWNGIGDSNWRWGR